MAVQFNLLPDVKLEYDRQQRTKRFIYTVSFLAIGVVVALFAVSFVAVNVLQNKLLSDANKDINNYSQKLKSIPNLEKVLTIQNQLSSLPTMHQQKHYTSRLFAYLPQITPTNVHIGKMSVDTTANTMSITGTADTVEIINNFVDTMKFTYYVVPGNLDENGCGNAGGKWNNDQQQCTKLAFANVLLTKVDRNDKSASYTVDEGFDPILFTGSQSVTLVVPQEITTRSVINSPEVSGQLFNGQTGKPSTNQQGAQ
jgi:Tfp pilus assembly protein PilN